MAWRAVGMGVCRVGEVASQIDWLVLATVITVHPH